MSHAVLHDHAAKATPCDVSGFFGQSLEHLAMLALGFALAACTSLPPNTDRASSAALAQPELTRLGRIADAARPGTLPAAESGFRLIAQGDEALANRIALADRAERTLDLQYYIIAQDASTNELFAHIVQAARRGVRVRLLVDDLNTSGEDAIGASLSTEPNIEVRLFNPFPGGRSSLSTRFLSSIGDARKLSRRMHNKLFAADNAMAIVGGRNLGDAYFLRNALSNFVDLDLLVAGPAVQALSATFDAYWNDPLTYPFTSVVGSGNAATLANQAPAKPQLLPAPESGLAHELDNDKISLLWAPAQVLVDQPSKISGTNGHDASKTFEKDLIALMRGAQKSVLLVSPYFVPGSLGVEIAADLRRRGVRLVILTNSLAATDAPAVHIGYSRYRAELLRQGAELYELRPQVKPLEGAPATRFGSFGQSRSSLHAKVIVVDQKVSVIGSLNLDPRSRFENTEMALFVDSAPLAAQVLDLFQDPAHENAYRLRLAPDGRSIEWVLGVGKAEQMFDNEPEASFWRRLELKLLTPFSLEALL